MVEAAIHDITEVEKELAVQVPALELRPHFEKAYLRAQSKIEVKGFRKGKVPLDIVKKMFADQIEHESLDLVATDIYRELAKERNIQPVGEPVLVHLDYKPGESFSFKIKYEVLPKIQLNEYKGLDVEKLVHTLTDREIDDEIMRLRRANATMVEVQTVTDDEHIVTADIQELDDTGFPVIGKRSENQRLYLGDENLHAEVKSALRSAAAATPVRVRYETKHGDHTHKANLQVTVRKIEKIQLPDFDDAFARKISKDKAPSAAEFRENLRKDLEGYWADRSERRLVDLIAGEIIRRHDFPVPESLVRGIVSRGIEELKNRLPGKALPPDFDEAKYREEMQPSAIWQAKWFLLRERILEKERLQADESELERLAGEKAKETGIEKEKLLDFFRKSEEVRRQLVSEKLITFLKSKSNITEKTTEEFF